MVEDWSDDYANSDHWLKYPNAGGPPSDHNWPEGLTEDRDKILRKDNLLVPEKRVEDLIHHGHNAQLNHPGGDELQKDLESRFLFLSGLLRIFEPVVQGVCGLRGHRLRAPRRLTSS